MRGGRGGLACIAQWWPIVSPALTLSPTWPVKQGHHTTHACPPQSTHNWTTTNKWAGSLLQNATTKLEKLLTLRPHHIKPCRLLQPAKCNPKPAVWPSVQLPRSLQTRSCTGLDMHCSRDYAISGKNMLRPRAQALECCRGCPGKMVFNLETPVL